MIQKSIYTAIVLIVFGLNILGACDVCGANSNGIGIGLLSNYKSNSLRLSFMRTSFSALYPNDYQVNDDFMQIDIFARFAISDKLLATARMPYKYNQRQSTETARDHIDGVGDVSLGLQYILLNNENVGNAGTLYVELGGGIIAPTGTYDPDLHNRLLPENFNLGKGAWSYTGQSSIVYNTPDFGLVWSNYYQWNTSSNNGYTFGNQINTQLTIFKEYSYKGLFLTPNLGVSYERTSIDHYANNNDVSGTGGSSTMLTAGTNVRLDSWMLGINYSKPLTNNFADGVVNLDNRSTIQISYLF